ncbi:hypothetical protein D3C76_1063920 [compost metagenome]
MTAAEPPRRTGEQQAGGQHKTDEIDQQRHPDKPGGHPGGAGFSSGHRARVVVIQLAKTAAERLKAQQQAHTAEKRRHDIGVNVGREDDETHFGRKPVGTQRQHHADGDQADADRQLRRHHCAQCGHLKAARP